MGITKDIQKATEDYRASIEALLVRFKVLIDDLPENDKIKPISSSMFIVQYSDLCFRYIDDNGKIVSGSNWSPTFHHFRWQYEKVYEVLSSMTDKTKMADRLERIIKERRIETKFISYGEVSSRFYNFHSKVVKNLKTIL